MKGRTERTEENAKKFLQLLSNSANVTGSAAAAGLTRSMLYEWRDADPEFAKRWDEAVERGNDALEDEAVRRGRDGYEKPVFQQGREVGRIREYSDTLLIFMLKGRRPDKFRDNVRTEITGHVTLEQLITQATAIDPPKPPEIPGRVIDVTEDEE